MTLITLLNLTTAYAYFGIQQRHGCVFFLRMPCCTSGIIRAYVSFCITTTRIGIAARDCRIQLKLRKKKEE